jgi:conjugal transfer pilus assembly protein TraU
MMRLILACFLFFAIPPSQAQAQVGDATCHGKFVNPITDICWSCLFPLSVGGLEIWPSDRPDTKNPVSPVCACGTPTPRIGIAIGFWEPSRMIDVTTKPWCFPSLGGTSLNPGFDIGRGQSTHSMMGGGADSNSAKYYAHYYIYPLLYWMEILTDFACFEQSTFDIAYVTEIDPLWNDSQLTALINPEVALFANPIAVAACVADCAKTSAKKLPIDELFWCAGCQGSMYPMNGNISASVSRAQSGRLAAERILYKMHRMGLSWGTAGSRALCGKYLMPVLKKSQYRIQMTNPVATTKGDFACSPIGATTMNPQTGRTYPVKGEDMSFLIWRKRNCCLL